MSDEAVPSRAERAFADHGSFEALDDGRYEAVTTPFDGTVVVFDAGDGEIGFDVEVRVPMLDAVAADEVAPVVEEGWYETFERRMEDLGGVTAAEHNLDPAVETVDSEAVVTVGFTDLNERRGVDDAAAVVDYVEGTFVQGMIPGYDYVDPAASLLERAQGTGKSA
ncbi:DUF5813 family protein [Halobium salinum]|uniref:DUF5813 family protein n=1 Tax=Halobium salinum TaxID=1364940 RepID=A0ABD5PAZ0_9EURY|nr:DUF5813 family protein [Halobium salinum]